MLAALIAAGISGYGWWTALGDSWLLTSISGFFWGAIGCTITRNLAPSFNVVSARHPARFPKVR
jgi:hypothetical protein